MWSSNRTSRFPPALPAFNSQYPTFSLSPLITSPSALDSPHLGRRSGISIRRQSRYFDHCLASETFASRNLHYLFSIAQHLNVSPAPRIASLLQPCSSLLLLLIHRPRAHNNVDVRPCLLAFSIALLCPRLMLDLRRTLPTRQYIATQ